MSFQSWIISNIFNLHYCAEQKSSLNFFLCIIYFLINSQLDYVVFCLINEVIHLSSA